MSHNTPDNESGNLFSVKYILISVGLSLLGMGVVIYFTWSPGILDHLAMKRMPGLVIALAVAFLRIWFVATKFHFLAEGDMDWHAALRVALTWDFASAVTPSTIGGAPIATYAMTSEGMKLGKATALTLYSVLLDQFWYALAIPILLIGGVWVEVIPPEIGFVGAATMLLIYGVLLAYGGVLTYGLLVKPSTIGNLVRWTFRLPFLRRFESQVSKEADNMEAYSEELREKSFSFIFKAFFLSTMAWLCKVALPVIVVLSLLPAQEVVLVFRSLAMNLASLVIPTPGGSGGVEGLFALFMGPLIEREGFIGLAVFLWRFITYYMSIGIGVFATTWYMKERTDSRQLMDS
ncbi:MAG: lysylphosphatidylglycerol synthase transmembrane domain-containing protein [Balneolaceae bacterium]